MRSIEKPKGTFRSFRTVNDFCIAQSSFSFSVKIYDGVGDGDNHSYETFGLGRTEVATGGVL